MFVTFEANIIEIWQLYLPLFKKEITYNEEI